MTLPRLALAVPALALLLAAGACGKQRPPDALDDNMAAAASAPAAPPAEDSGRLCSSLATVDLVKLELFDQAARIRGRDQAQYREIAGFSLARIDRPLLKADDGDLGVVTCAGAVTIELPPGIEIGEERRSLTGFLNYTLQPGAGKSGPGVTLTGADSIVTPLATLAPAPDPEPIAPYGPLDPTDPTYDGPGEIPPPIAQPPIAPPPPPPRPAPQPRPRAASVEPSYNCAQARTRTEHAVCANPELARLDRSMADRYLRALYAADPATALDLRRTRSIFLVNRESCATDRCIAQVYRVRMREIEAMTDPAR